MAPFDKLMRKTVETTTKIEQTYHPLYPNIDLNVRAFTGGSTSYYHIICHLHQRLCSSQHSPVTVFRGGKVGRPAPRPCQKTGRGGLACQKKWTEVPQSAPRAGLPTRLTHPITKKKKNVCRSSGLARLTRPKKQKKI